MIRGLLLLLLLTAVPVLPAQQPAPPSAKVIAARVDHHYNALHSLKVGFTQDYSGMGMNVKERGTLLLKKPGRMRWDYAQPAGKLFLLDGHNGYFYAPGQSEAQKVPAKKLDDIRSPLSLLLGHTNLEKELTGLTMAEVNGQYLLRGVPRGMENRVRVLEITAAADGAILRMRIEETDGAVNSFVFQGEQPNAPAPDAAFVFHAPEGVNVVDGMPPV